MKIVVAPDSFKGSLSALKVSRAMERGIRKVNPKINVCLLPMADGGEGTVEALVTALGGEIIPTVVTGPLGDPVNSFFGLLGDGTTAVIEMAAASGLPLVPAGRRNPLVTTSCGTGQLIRFALERGASQLIIGIGGSATNDGGAGMVQALGARLLDAEGRELAYGGGNLDLLHSIDMNGLDSRLRESRIRVACDVTNPLCGPKGASAVFGPQKGATAEMVAVLDKNLNHYADVLEAATGKKVREMEGAGAAGGLGAALLAIFNADLLPGSRIVLDAGKADRLMEGADLVITGEGRTDSQTLYGKVPAGVAELAAKHHVPVVCISGGLTPDAVELYQHGFSGLFSITEGPISLEQAMTEAEPLVERAAERVARMFLAGWGKAHL